MILHSDLGAVAAAALLLDRRCSACSRRPDRPRTATSQHLSRLWLGLAGGALLFRTVQLFFIRSVQTGLVWFTKILTDPFHDIYALPQGAAGTCCAAS